MKNKLDSQSASSSELSDEDLLKAIEDSDVEVGALRERDRCFQDLGIGPGTHIVGAKTLYYIYVIWKLKREEWLDIERPSTFFDGMKNDYERAWRDGLYYVNNPDAVYMTRQDIYRAEMVWEKIMFRKAKRTNRNELNLAKMLLTEIRRSIQAYPKQTSVKLNKNTMI